MKDEFIQKYLMQFSYMEKLEFIDEPHQLCFVNYDYKVFASIDLNAGNAALRVLFYIMSNSTTPVSPDMYFYDANFESRLCTEINI